MFSYKWLDDESSLGRTCLISRSSSVSGGLDGLLLDTADTGTGLNTDLDVTGISPGGAPRVLNEVVRGTVFDTVSDGEDTVIELSSASGSGKDTSLVSLESNFVGLDGNRDGGFIEGSLELVRVVGGDHGVSGGLNGGSLNGRVASSNLSSSRGVRVVSLEDGVVVLVESEGEGHGATIASVVKLGARDELLLGEGEEFLGGNEMGSFHSSGGGERPA